MEKFIIKWNAGFGVSAEIVDAKDFNDASQMARDACMDDVESNINYSAGKATAYEVYNYGLDPSCLCDEQRAIYDKEYGEDIA